MKMKQAHHIIISNLGFTGLQISLSMMMHEYHLLTYQMSMGSGLIYIVDNGSETNDADNCT